MKEKPDKKSQKYVKPWMFVKFPFAFYVITNRSKHNHIVFKNSHIIKNSHPVAGKFFIFLKNRCKPKKVEGLWIPVVTD